jgi:hypothetical protein
LNVEEEDTKHGIRLKAIQSISTQRHYQQWICASTKLSQISSLLIPGGHKASKELTSGGCLQVGEKCVPYKNQKQNKEIK